MNDLPDREFEAILAHPDLMEVLRVRAISKRYYLKQPQNENFGLFRTEEGLHNR